MQRIDTSRAVASRPAAGAAAASPGFFSEGNPSTGTLATQLSGEWCNAVQESIIRTIQGGLITPASGAIGDTNLLESIKNLHRPLMNIYLSPAGFIPAPSQTYNATFEFTPQFPSLIFAVSWHNSAAEQPIDVNDWSIRNTIIINNITLSGSNTALTSVVFGMSTVSANVQCSIVGQLVTGNPGVTFRHLQQGLAFIAFPWAG